MALTYQLFSLQCSRGIESVFLGIAPGTKDFFLKRKQKSPRSLLI